MQDTACYFHLAICFVVLVGSKQAIAMAVRNNRIAARNTRLAQRLKDYTPPKEKKGYRA
jgi:hypothetical protein